MTCREPQYICKQSPSWTKFSHTIFITFPSPKPSYLKNNIYLCLKALYINTPVSFESNTTKIYYCWPPILDPIIWKEHLYFGSPHNISVWHLLQRPGKLIRLPVRDNWSSQGISVQVRKNWTLSKKSEGGDIFLHILCSKTYSISGILFPEIKQQADIGFPIRSIHSVLYIHNKFMK